MKILAVAATIAVTAAAYAANIVQPGAFSMTLPSGFGDMTKQVNTIKSPEGDIPTTTWVSKAPTNEAVIVTISQLPAKILDPQKLIDSTTASLIKSLGAELETSTPRPGDAASARILFHNKAAWCRARFTVNGDRLYQLLYVGRSPEQRAAPAVEQLFDSFKIAATSP